MRYSRFTKYRLGFYPDDLIHCSVCGNYPESGIQLFQTTTFCCIVSLSPRNESGQMKLISFSKMF